MVNKKVFIVLMILLSFYSPTLALFVILFTIYYIYFMTCGPSIPIIDSLQQITPEQKKNFEYCGVAYVKLDSLTHDYCSHMLTNYFTKLITIAPRNQWWDKQYQCGYCDYSIDKDQAKNCVRYAVLSSHFMEYTKSPELCRYLKRALVIFEKVGKEFWGLVTEKKIPREGKRNPFAIDHFPVQTEDLPEKEKGFFRVFYSNRSGLEARINSFWIPLSPKWGYCIVLAGRLTEEATNGKIKAPLIRIKASNQRKISFSLTIF